MCNSFDSRTTKAVNLITFSKSNVSVWYDIVQLFVTLILEHVVFIETNNSKNIVNVDIVMT